MPDISWYWRRLSVMSPGEVGFRIAKALLGLAEPLGLRRVPSLVPLMAGSHRRGLPDIELSMTSGAQLYADVAAAAAAADGRGRILGIDDARFGPEPGWNRDPKTGVIAPLVRGKTIDYRDERLVGDIKYLWEPNRHLHLPMLAQAAAISGECWPALEVQRHLVSWWDQCPYPMGPNWTSALEVALRLINWSWTWRILGGAKGLCGRWGWEAATVERWNRSVSEHIHFCATSYSAYSSANNHLIGEAAGVFVGAHTWPLGPKFDAWRSKAKAVLERECLRQYTADGVNLEQASSYQLFSFELLASAGIVGQLANDPFPEPFWQRLAVSMAFVAAVYSPTDGLPQLGDSDDALVLQLAPPESVRQVEADLYLAGVLFDREDLCRLGDIGRERALWILGGISAPMTTASPPEPAVERPGTASIRSFPEGGYHLLEATDPAGTRLKALLDVGPLGYLSIAAHGHADALSMLLWVDDLEFLIDAGTYAYHTEPEWRSYFRGTSAHNTVTVDELDQSVPAGNFMWIRHARSQLLDVSKSTNLVRVKGRHDGYRRLRDPVTHERTVTVDASAGEITVLDALQGKNEHTLDLRWHVSDRCKVMVDADSVTLARGRIAVCVHCDGPHGGPSVLRGSMSPLAGWMSRRFGVREACSTLRFTGKWHGEARMVTKFRVERRS